MAISEGFRKSMTVDAAGESAADAQSMTDRKSDWRRRERRQAKKYFGKRLTDADHELIKNYAHSLQVDMSELIAPYIETILDDARAHAQESTGALAS